jgi:hypothetical protein
VLRRLIREHDLAVAEGMGLSQLQVPLVDTFEHAPAFAEDDVGL